MFVGLTQWNANQCNSLRTFQTIFPTAMKLFYPVTISERTRHKAPHPVTLYATFCNIFETKQKQK